MQSLVRRTAIASVAAAALVLPSAGVANADDSVLSYNSLDVALAIPVTVCGNTIALIPILAVAKAACEVVNVTKFAQGDKITHAHHVVKIKKTKVVKKDVDVHRHFNRVVAESVNGK